MLQHLIFVADTHHLALAGTRIQAVAGDCVAPAWLCLLVEGAHRRVRHQMSDLAQKDSILPLYFCRAF